MDVHHITVQAKVPSGLLRNEDYPFLIRFGYLVIAELRKQAGAELGQAQLN